MKERFVEGLLRCHVSWLEEEEHEGEHEESSSRICFGSWWDVPGLSW